MYEIQIYIVNALTNEIKKPDRISNLMRNQSK